MPEPKNTKNSSRIFVGEIAIWDDHEEQEHESGADIEERLDDLLSFIQDMCLDSEYATGAIATKAKEVGLRVDAKNF